ncbi:hypothetical protein LSH36_375g01051 [Paralvinella palmiformis]|uniref:peptidylamidoglycolate lyase n=1 Tax=Paralvinella palmiformis TaxID=53620 RepID=A0AAD9JDF4_9ANNE|nr:hypothetical protein LSH36_375g01051 [Paralvinella palmiformis]
MQQWVSVITQQHLFMVIQTCSYYYRLDVDSRVITGYQYNSSWHLLGKGNPQWPQAFFPVSESLVIRSGDYLVSRCTFNSMDQTKTVRIGMTHLDEMCNYYIMYYTKSHKGRTYYACGGNKFPELAADMPEGSDVALPPNPLLEDVARGKLPGNLTPSLGYHSNFSKHDHSFSWYKHVWKKRNLLHQTDNEEADDNGDGKIGAHPHGGGGGGGAGGGGGGRGGVRAGTEGGFVIAGKGDHVRHRANFSRDHHGAPGTGISNAGTLGSTGYGRHGPAMPYAYPQWYNHEHYPDTYDFAYNNQEDYSDDKERFYDDVSNQRSRNRGRARGGTSNQAPTRDGAQIGWQKTIGRKPGPGFLQSHGPHRSHDPDATDPKTKISKTTSPSHNAKISDLTTQSISVVSTKSGLMSTVKSVAKQPNDQNTTLLIEEVPDWPVAGPKLGQLVGVATDSHRNVHLFHRGTRVWDDTSFTLDNVLSDKDSEAIGQDVLLTLDEDGKVVDSWGKDMFYMPHGLHIDDKDNIWVTDVGLHQVMRFPVSYHKPDLVLGTKMEPGSDSNHFCKPTDVATIRNGQFYVTDGYCNHRVMKFSADGKLMKEWGSSSSSLSGDGFPPPGDFNTPHSIAIYEQENILCVADRENRRIQCFDLEGNFLRQMHAPEITGKVFAVSFDPVTGGLYAINGKDVYKQVVTVEGFTFDARTGKLLQTWSPMSDSSWRKRIRCQFGECLLVKVMMMRKISMAFCGRSEEESNVDLDIVVEEGIFQSDNELSDDTFSDIGGGDVTGSASDDGDLCLPMKISNARTSFLEALVLVLIAMFVFCVLILDSSWAPPFNDFTSRRGLLVYVHLVAAHLVNLLTSFAKPFHQAHDITVSVDGKAVYVTDISSNKIWKFSLTRIDGLHKPEKKSGHPPTIDDDDDDGSDEVLDDAGGSDFGASLIIGGLLIIPVFIIIIITVVLRLRKSGKLYYFFGNRNRNRRLNLGTLLSRGRHRFSPLSTEDKDPELDLLNSDPEIEEYSIMENKTA